MSKDILPEESKFVSILNKALKEVRSTDNPVELNQLRKIFKKNVPLTMRSYVAAYLAKAAVSGGFSSKPYKNKMKSNSERILIRPSKPHNTLPEDKSVSLFISIGKKRGVFPKDIIFFLIQNSGILREHIGDIRILPNYSFVQIDSEAAPIVVEKLNNSIYRGKAIAVSYSKKQDFSEYDEDKTEENGEEDLTGSKSAGDESCREESFSSPVNTD